MIMRLAPCLLFLCAGALLASGYEGTGEDDWVEPRAAPHPRDGLSEIILNEEGDEVDDDDEDNERDEQATSHKEDEEEEKEEEKDEDEDEERLVEAGEGSMATPKAYKICTLSNFGSGAIYHLGSGEVAKEINGEYKLCGSDSHRKAPVYCSETQLTTKISGVGPQFKVVPLNSGL